MNTGRRIRIVLIVVLSLALVVLLVYIASVLLSYKKDQDTYQDIRESFVEVVTETEEEETEEESFDETAPVDSDQFEDSAKKHKKEYAPIKVDFDALLQNNPDTIGWLYCPDTEINYPVVYRENDNLYYVEHDFEGNETRAGAIFLDGNNKNWFEDYNSIIYGHNMKDNTMLSHLFNWSEKEYVDAHPYMWLLTPKGDYKLEIFSGYISEAFAKSVFLIYERPSDELVEYMNDRKELSMFESDVEIEQNMHYVMFSTCNSASDYGRFILHAKMLPLDSTGGVHNEELIEE